VVCTQASPVSAQLLNVSTASVSITSPAAGAWVKGMTTVTASPTGLAGGLTLVGVQFQIDGVNLGGEDTTAPFSIPWNTVQSTNGSHTLTAVGRDLLGGRSTSPPVTVTVDNVVPTVTINQSAGQADPTNGSLVNFTVVFSEAVTGFVAGDVAIAGSAGGTKTVTVTGGPSTYTVSVSGMADGTVTATVAGGAAQDAAGNGSLASTSTDNTVTRDTTPPTVTINQAAGQPDPEGDTDVAFTAVFSEPVLDFTGSDITLAGTAGGTKTIALTGGPTTYNVFVSGATDGTLIATISASTVRDAAGNQNTASTSTDNTVLIDATPPPPPSAPDLTSLSDSGVSDTDNITSDSTPTFTGTAETGSIVRLSSDGVQVGEGVAVNGTYTITTSALTDGSHSITAIATDGGSRTSSPSTASRLTIDTGLPAVALTAPSAGATVSGSVSVTAGASDGNGVAAVQFQLDGTAIGTEATAAPYSTTWDTKTAPNGSHTLSAIARDAAGNTATSASLMVTVNNDTHNALVRVEDSSADIAYTPSGWMLGYSGGFAWSGGTAALGFVAGQRATFSFSGTGISWIGFRGPQAGIANVYLDGALAATVDTYAPEAAVQAVLFTASNLASGTHTLIIDVTRTKNDASSDYYVVVDAFDVIGGTTAPDTTAPTVAITAPANQSTVFGTTSIHAAASDNVNVTGVRFFVDGVEIGDDTAAPYTTQWVTATSGDGSHTLTAVARDGAGNTATSAAVTVTVSNAAPPSATTFTRFENTDPAVTYTDGAPIRPHRWWHGSRSRSWSADISSFNRSPGATATFRFRGTSVRWIGFRGYWAGIARVSIDSGPFAEVDLFIPPCTPEQRAQGCRDEEPQVSVFGMSGLASDVEHTLVIESTGRKRGGDACTPAPSADCSQDYAVVVDAIDVAPAMPAPATGVRSDDTEPAVTYAGTWQQDANAEKGWNGGTAALSETAGSSATFNFAGTAVNWVGFRGPATGIARIYVDGVLEQEFDTYSPVEVTGVVFALTNLAVGSHTLRIEATGTRAAKSAGSAIYVDGFDVRSRFEDLDRSVTFTTSDAGASWALDNADKAWSGASANVGTGTAARSLTAGARAEFAFHGTGVTWIGMRGPASGMADVSLDGALVSRVDLYSPTEQVQTVVLSLTNLSDGPHTLRIDVAGVKNSASSSTVVIVDAFDVTLALPQPPTTRVQENSAAVVYSGSWTPGSRFSYWSGEFARYTETTGAQATFTFSGTSIRWLGERRRNGGIARVSLDGVFVAEVDTYWWLQDEFQAALFSRTGLTPGTHTLTIEVTGQKRGGSTCEGAPSPTCSAGYFVVVDAFDVQP
jgi:hypothetical protein